MTVDRLGRDRARLRARLRKAAATARAAAAQDDAAVRADLAAANLAAALLGWGIHGEWIPRLDAPSAPTLAELLRGARVFAQRSARGLEAIVEMHPSPDDLLHAAELALDAGIGQGYEHGAHAAAVAVAIGYKTWVRITPVKEPRDWHTDGLEGVTIERDALFTLPGGPNKGMTVLGPHDFDSLVMQGGNGAAEWYNCGHALIYTDAP